MRVRQDDLARLQALLVDNVLLGGESEPDRCVFVLVLLIVLVVCEKTAFGSSLRLVFLGGFDVL